MEKKATNTWQYEDIGEPQEAELTAEDASEGEGRPASPEDELFDKPQKSTHRNTIMLLGTCLIAVAVIYFLGMGQKAKPLSEAEKAKVAELDVALAKLVTHTKTAKTALPATQNMADLFSSYPNNNQLSLDELRRNPFLRHENTTVEVAAPVAAGPDMEALKKTLKQLKLQSSSGTICLINDKMLKVGDKIDPFTVKTINGDNVILTVSDKEFILKM